jgi:DNA-binding NarL/FixJ family response regulator
VVLLWTTLTLDLIRVHSPNPVRAARALALLHVALHDTLVATWDARTASQLPPDQRQILELRLAGLTGPEIAAALGRSLGAVKIAQVRAFARLRATLDSASADVTEGHR